MTDTQKVEWLAEFMGWTKHQDGNEWMWDRRRSPQESSLGGENRAKGKRRFVISFDPLTDWNHWRQVEEKVMEDDKLHCKFIESVVDVYRGPRGQVEDYMKADLPNRAKALYLAMNGSR